MSHGYPLVSSPRRNSIASSTFRREGPTYGKPDLSFLLNTRPETAYCSPFDEDGQSKRTRMLTTPYQLQKLTDLYNESPFPSTTRRDELAASLDMSPRRVQVWFQNKRQGQKKEAIKRDAKSLLSRDYAGSDSSFSTGSSTRSDSPYLLNSTLPRMHSITSSYPHQSSHTRSSSSVSRASSSYSYPPIGHSYTSYREPSADAFSPLTPSFAPPLPTSSSYSSLCSSTPSRSRRSSFNLSTPPTFPSSRSSSPSSYKSTDLYKSTAEFTLPPMSTLASEVDRMMLKGSQNSYGATRPAWY